MSYKTCLSCNYYNDKFAICKCTYHMTTEDVYDEIDGKKYTIPIKFPHDPLKMRRGKAFRFLKWRNCGKDGKFWEKRVEEMQCLKLS